MFQNISFSLFFSLSLSLVETFFKKIIGVFKMLENSAHSR
jgi:hypothetical protein